MSEWYDGRKVVGRLGLLGFYRNQLKKFERVGLGNKTEFNVTVTDVLINATHRRIKELQVKGVKK